MNAETNTQRDELAVFLVNHDIAVGNFVSRPKAYDGRADAILAAGYRKPRTITTVEELDALPDGTIILSEVGGCWEAGEWRGHGMNWWKEPGRREIAHSEDLALPATVLYTPEAAE